MASAAGGAGTSASALKEDLGGPTASTIDVLGSMDGWGTRSLSGMAQFMEVGSYKTWGGGCPDRAVWMNIAG